MFLNHKSNGPAIIRFAKLNRTIIDKDRLVALKST